MFNKRTWPSSEPLANYNNIETLVILVPDVRTLVFHAPVTSVALIKHAEFPIYPTITASEFED